MAESLLIAERVELANPRWVRAGALSERSLLLSFFGALSFAAATVLKLDAPWLAVFPCPFRALTGLPCLGCGATHAFVHLAHGELVAAIAANPLWALFAAILWCSTIFTVLRLAGLNWTLAIPKPSLVSARRMRLFALCLVAANWSYVAMRH